MNKRRSLFSTHQFAVQGLIVGIGLWLGVSARAQVNYVRNPGFESPIGTNAYGNALGGANFPLGFTTGGEVYDPAWQSTGNWMIAYPWGGPDDFECKDRCTNVRGGSANYFSAKFRPAHDKWMHAYYTQTVTNLTAGHSYTVSGYMMEDRWTDPTDHAFRNEFTVYIEAVGGQGTPASDGRASVLAVATVTNNLDAPYTYPNNTWLQFVTQQTPDTNRCIEIRLHFNKPSWCLFDKLELMGSYFDDIALTP